MNSREERVRSISGNIKQTDGISGAGGCRPNAWKSCALALGLCGFVGALPDTGHAEGAVTSAQLETHACQTTLGFNPSEAEYAACIGSLNRSLAVAHDADDASGADDISRNPLERACAEVGIRPNSSTFEKCVLDLSTSLLKLESIPGR